MQRHWLSFKKDEIMYTDGLETEYFLCGGTAQFPLFHAMMVLTRPFYFFKEFCSGYNAMNVYGKCGRESLLFLILSPSQETYDITSFSCPQK